MAANKSTSGQRYIIDKLCAKFDVDRASIIEMRNSTSYEGSEAWEYEQGLRKQSRGK